MQKGFDTMGEPVKSTKAIKVFCCMMSFSVLFCFALLIWRLLLPTRAFAAEMKSAKDRISVSMTYRQMKSEDDLTDGKTWIAAGPRSVTMTITPRSADGADWQSSSDGSLTIEGIGLSGSGPCPVLQSDDSGQGPFRTYTLGYTDGGGSSHDGQDYSLDNCRLKFSYTLTSNNEGGKAESLSGAFSETLSSIGMVAVDSEGKDIDFAQHPNSIIVDSTSDRSLRLWVSGAPEADPLSGYFSNVDTVSLSSRDPWLDRIVNIAFNNHKKANSKTDFAPMTISRIPRHNQADDPNHQPPVDFPCGHPVSYSQRSARIGQGHGDHSGVWKVLNQSCKADMDRLPYNANARYEAHPQEELARYLHPADAGQDHNHLSFVYDTEKPMLTSASYLSHGLEAHPGDDDFPVSDGVMAFKDRVIRLRTKDIRPSRPIVDSSGRQHYPPRIRDDGRSDPFASGLGGLILDGSRYDGVDSRGNPRTPVPLKQCSADTGARDGGACDYSVSAGSDEQGEYYDVDFRSSGYYDFSAIRAKVVDKAGNEDDFFLLKSGQTDRSKAPDTDAMIGRLLIDVSYETLGEPRIAVSSRSPGAPRKPGAVPPVPSGSGLDRYYFNSDVRLAVQTKDQYLAYYLRTLANDPRRNVGVLKYWRDDLPNGPNEAKTACKVEESNITEDRRENWTWSLACADSVGQVNGASGSYPTNGQYTFMLNADIMPGWFTSSRTQFGIDTSAPVADGFEGPRGDGLKIIRRFPIKGSHKTIVTSPGENHIRFRVQDLLPKEQRGADKVPGASQEGASGIAGDCAVGTCHGTVQISMPAPTDLQGNAIGDPAARNMTIPVDESGWFKIDLKDEGLYDLSKIVLTAVDWAEHPVNSGDGDRARNVLKVSLDELVNKYPDAAGFNEGYDALVIDNPQNQRTAEIILRQAESNPVSTDPAYYFRGEALVDFKVKDRWFPLYQAVDDESNQNFFHGSVSPAAPKAFPAVSFEPDAWVPDSASPDTWVFRGYRVPRSSANQNSPHEGVYELAVSYAGLQCDSSRFAAARRKFVIDYTGPQLGGLHLSATTPHHWQWIFPASPLHVSLDGVKDQVAGVDAKTASFADYQGDEATPMLGYDPWLAPQDAQTPESTLRFESDEVIAFDMNADSQRLRFDATSIAVKDLAGNPSSTHALNSYGDNRSDIVNDAQGYAGAALDLAGPKITVAYDNNDVRNGKYYKAKREATVVVDESNFDFIRAEDGRRIIVESQVDGRRARLAAKDFSNPSGDKHTYLAKLACENDGDWTVDASLTDPGEHRGLAYHDEFVIDTTRPVLSLKFDNNDCRNGMYYKAPRVATIELVERNFSKGESTVTTTAKDDAGHEVPASAGDGWSYAGDPKKHTLVQQVSFKGEYHYTLEANATDLAGNTAEAAKEPEFVIDMTKPDLHIEKVEDKTAYAGTVAPRIQVADTNMDQSRTTYALVGDRRGKVKSADLDPKEHEEDNARTVDIPDFKRKVATDDVYTLTATSEDMAGNSTSVSKTFSVNRFGSTYLFSAGTSSIRGAYLKKAVPVAVTELNVSGIDWGKSAIKLAKDGRIRAVPGSDYRIVDDSDSGWSKQTYEIPARVFKGDGYYRLMLTSTDRAGNLSENTMQHKDAKRKGDASVNFAVDSQAPTASALGIASNGVYYGQRHSVGIDAKDNMKVRSAQIDVDDRAQGQWSGDELLRGAQSIDLPADAHKHTVTVRTEDAAGNISSITYQGVVVASDWWQYIRENGLLFVLVICLGILMALAAFVLAALIVRHHAEMSYRRNPFGRQER